MKLFSASLSRMTVRWWLPFFLGVLILANLPLPLRAQTGGTAPAAASAVSVTAITTTGAQVAWQDNSNNEDSFRIELSVSPFTVWTAAGTTAANIRTFTLTGLGAFTNYSARVVAVNSNGESISAARTFTTVKLGGDFLGHSIRSGSIYYFAFSGPNRLERYDVAARAWLSAISNNATVTALWVDADGIYAAEGRTIVRWNPDGSGRRTLLTSTVDLVSLATVDNYLVYFNNFYPLTANKNTGTPIQTTTSGNRGIGLSYDPVLKRIFHCAPPSSSIRTYFLDLGPTGLITEHFTQGDTGAYPRASRTFTFPSGGRIADNAGQVFSADSLEHLGTLGAAFTDVTFVGSDVPLVLRGDKLTAYTNTMKESASFSLGTSAGLRVTSDAGEAVVFLTDYGNTHGLSIRGVPLTSLPAPLPGLPKDPASLAFTVDDAFVDKRGVLHLLSRAQSCFFRWSTVTKEWLETAPLSGAPSKIAYAPELDAVYCNYRSNRITLSSLDTLPLAERFFARSSGDPGDMAAMGDLLYVTRRAVYEVLSPQGLVLSNGGDSGGYTGAQCVWDPVQRRVYHFGDARTSTYLAFEAFDTAGLRTSQNLGSGNYDGSSRIRVKPDGSLLAAGDGGVTIRPTDLQITGSVQTDLKDMLWEGNQLLGLESLLSTTTKVQRWDAALQRTQSILLPGQPQRIFPLSGGQVLVVTQAADGLPQMHLLDPDLAVTFTTRPAPPALLSQPANLRLGFGSSGVLQVEILESPGLTFAWFKDNEPIPGATSRSLSFSNAGSKTAGSYTLRITNPQGSVTTLPAIVSVGPAGSPGFAPGNLLVSSTAGISEYTPQGQLVKTVRISYPAGLSSPLSLDLAVDSVGRVHIITRGFLESGVQYYITTYDPASSSWRHLLYPSLDLGEKANCDLAVSGDWAVTRQGLIHVTTGEFRTLPAGFPVGDMATGLNNVVYGVGSTVRRLTLDPLAWGSSVNLSGANVNGINGLGIAANGAFYAADPYGNISSYAANGAKQKTLVLAVLPGTVQDLSLSSTGRIAIGHNADKITLTTTALTSETSFTLANATFGSFTAWMPEIPQARPSFSPATVVPAGLEDTAWSWSPVFSHPDPDAVLTLEAVSLPAWMQLVEGRLSGTPLQVHVGDNRVTLRLRNGQEPAVEQTFTVPVTAVNDAPAGTALTLNRQEDAAEETVNLASLFLDEETPSEALNYVISSPPPGIVQAEGIPGTASLRLRWLADANGPTQLTVRATDAGGLSAEAVITINTAAVNDPPTGSLDPLTLDEDAAAVEINLEERIRDVESPVTLLTFEAVSSTPAFAVAVVEGRKLKITPQPDAFGALTIRVRCQDPEGAFVEVAMPLTLNPVNDAPRGTLAAVAVDEDSPALTIDLAAAFSDVESADARLTFAADSPQPGICAVAVAGSTLTLTPQRDAHGVLSIPVRCTDPEGAVVTVPLALTIRPVNDAPTIPTALPDLSGGAAGADALIDFMPYAVDPDAPETLTWRVKSNTNPALFQELSFDALGRLTIRYSPYVSGEAIVTVEARDGQGATAERSFKISLPDIPAPFLRFQAAMTMNRQIGLWEQRLTVTNTGGRAMGGFEITVSGLAPDASLYNAGQVLAGGGKVGYYQPVAPGAAVDIVLEYYTPARTLPQPVVTAAAVMPAASALSAGMDIAIDVARMTAPGSFLLEFTTVPGALYQVQYNTGSGWMDSVPRIRAAGSRVQWLDQGPPRTVSPPAPGAARFYRVKKLAQP